MCDLERLRKRTEKKKKKTRRNREEGLQDRSEGKGKEEQRPQQRPCLYIRPSYGGMEKHFKFCMRVHTLISIIYVN